MKNLHKYTKMNKQLDYLNVAWEISPESEKISPITFSPIQVYDSDCQNQKLRFWKKTNTRDTNRVKNRFKILLLRLLSTTNTKESQSLWKKKPSHA